jgi:hypothetical protein
LVFFRCDYILNAAEGMAAKTRKRLKEPSFEPTLALTPVHSIGEANAPEPFF